MTHSTLTPQDYQSRFVPHEKNERGETFINEPGDLFNEKGLMAHAGYAFSPVLAYDRKRIAASKLRIKEWDYYLVNDDKYALCFTIGDLGYMSMISASLVDFEEQDFITESVITPFPLGRLHMPSTSKQGLTTFSNKRVSMEFVSSDGVRHLSTRFANFGKSGELNADIILENEPRDSMVIATPWREDPKAFYYNQKIIGMEATGSFTYNEIKHDFSPNDSFGLLDWGRGVWTRDNIWFWAAAQGRQDGDIIGFNLGYGFGDTSAASENMFFLNGKAHKLGRVTFGTPVSNLDADHMNERYDLMKPWHTTDDEGRLDLTFTPVVDRFDYVNLHLVVSDQHQVYGLYNGFVVLDDGTKYPIKNLRASAEVVHNRY